MNKLELSMNDSRVVWVDFEQFGRTYKVPAVRIDGEDWIKKNPRLLSVSPDVCPWVKMTIPRDPALSGYQITAALDRDERRRELIRSGVLGDIHSALEDGAL